MIWNKNYHFV